MSKKVDDAISGKNDTSDKNEANKDVASDIRANEHAHGKGIYSNMSFDYGQLIKGSTLHTPSVNIGKPPHFDGTRYTDWSYKMKMHLIAARLWEVVDVGVMIPTDEDREITPEEVHNLHQNAQAVALLVSSLAPDGHCSRAPSSRRCQTPLSAPGLHPHPNPNLARLYFFLRLFI